MPSNCQYISRKGYWNLSLISMFFYDTFRIAKNKYIFYLTVNIKIYMRCRFMQRYQMIYKSLESYHSHNKVKSLIGKEIWALKELLVLKMQKISFDLIFIWCHIDYTNAHRDYERWVQCSNCNPIIWFHDDTEKGDKVSIFQIILKENNAITT